MVRPLRGLTTESMAHWRFYHCFQSSYSRHTDVIWLERRNCWGAPVSAYLAFLLLGIAPQLLQNMIFSEAPILAAVMPEGRAIQAHIIAAFMVANAVTLCYLILQFFFKISYAHTDQTSTVHHIYHSILY